MSEPIVRDHRSLPLEELIRRAELACLEARLAIREAQRIAREARKIRDRVQNRECCRAVEWRWAAVKMAAPVKRVLQDRLDT
jgi:hypothetical protein